MDNTPPCVLDGLNTAEFVQYVLNKHSAPSTLIVCCSKDDFFNQLHHALTEHSSNADEEMTEGRSSTLDPCQRLLQKPTLRLLASSRSVRVIFCPELPHLRAFLATFASQRARHSALSPSASRQGDGRILAILNPLRLHRPTSSYSAQGINRTFAIAVDAAYHTKAQLMLAECSPFVQRHERPQGSDELSVDLDDPLNVNAEGSPWDDEVSILNVTTKSFGAGERGWMGRTVSARRIAGRWCRFVDMSAHEV